MAGDDSEAAMGDNLLSNHRPDQPSVQPAAVSDWSWCGTRVPKNQVTYLTQVVLVFGIIAVSLSQIILQSSDRELWLVLLSTSIGYVLPSPRLRFLKPKISVTSAAATATTTTTAASSSALPFALSTLNFSDTAHEAVGGSSRANSDVGKEVD